MFKKGTEHSVLSYYFGKLNYIYHLLIPVASTVVLKRFPSIQLLIITNYSILKTCGQVGQAFTAMGPGGTLDVTLCRNHFIYKQKNLITRYLLRCVYQ